PVECPAGGPDLRQLTAQLRGLRQGRRRVGAQTAAQKAIDPVLGLPRRERLSQGRTMKWGPASDARVHLQGLVALDLVDVDDLPVVEDPQVHGFLRGQHEGPQEWRGDIPDGPAAGGERADLEGLEPETVSLGVGILPHVATRRQRCEQPVDGALLPSPSAWESSVTPISGRSTLNDSRTARALLTDRSTRAISSTSLGFRSAERHSAKRLLHSSRAARLSNRNHGGVVLGADAVPGGSRC